MRRKIYQTGNPFGKKRGGEQQLTKLKTRSLPAFAGTEKA